MTTPRKSRIEKHIVIQGTLSLQLRGPTSPRNLRRHDNKPLSIPDDVQCLGCWSPNAKHHPCLFCDSCLQTLKGAVKYKPPPISMFPPVNQQSYKSLRSNSYSFDSQDSDLTAWGKSDGMSKQHIKQNSKYRRAMLRTPTTNEVILNPSLGQDPEPYGRMLSPEIGDERSGKLNERNNENDQKEELRSIILREKALQFQKTATRCGFCDMKDKRTQLVVYCIHCKKHFCDYHRRFHSQMRIFRPHATINMAYGTNSALW